MNENSTIVRVLEASWALRHCGLGRAEIANRFGVIRHLLSARLYTQGRDEFAFLILVSKGDWDPTSKFVRLRAERDYSPSTFEKNIPLTSDRNDKNVCDVHPLKGGVLDEFAVAPYEDPEGKRIVNGWSKLKLRALSPKGE